MKTAILIGLYLAAIVASSLIIVAFGPTASIYSAFAFIGLTLIVRDALHDFWREHRIVKMFALIAVGAAVTVLINPAGGIIALASAVAFAASETVDYLAYRLMERLPWLARANGSNVPSALVDSIIFPTIAFGGILIPIMLGQFVAKVAGGFIWSLVIGAVRNRTAEVDSAPATA